MLRSLMSLTIPNALVSIQSKNPRQKSQSTQAIKLITPPIYSRCFPADNKKKQKCIKTAGQWSLTNVSTNFIQVKCWMNSFRCCVTKLITALTAVIQQISVRNNVASSMVLAANWASWAIIGLLSNPVLRENFACCRLHLLDWSVLANFGLQMFLVFMQCFQPSLTRCLSFHFRDLQECS